MAIAKEPKDKITYKFPKSEDIFICRADLQIQLQEFKKAISASFSVYDLLAVISLWIPVFTGGFDSVFYMSPEEVKSGYVVLAILITLIILYNKTKYNLLYLKNFLIKKTNNVSSDPKKMSQMILDQCQPKKEK